MISTFWNKWILVLLILSVVDIWQTLIFVNSGDYYELNAIIREYGIFMLVGMKILLFGACFLWCYAQHLIGSSLKDYGFITSGNIVIHFNILIIFVLLSAYVVGHNFFVIIDVENPCLNCFSKNLGLYQFNDIWSSNVNVSDLNFSGDKI